MPRSRSPFADAEAHLRAHALAKPEATEHFPWGERAIKVKGKVFLFMYCDATRLSLSTKLPESASVALLLPFANPTGYGLGKAGWVSAAFDAGDSPPLDMLCSWIDESYQAVAPAKLAAVARTGEAPTLSKAAAAPKRKVAARKPRAAARKPRAAARKPRAAARKPRAAARKPRAAARKRKAAARA
jgi:predicted DNA-binding protein (MmcQ/YjbR family)